MACMLNVLIMGDVMLKKSVLVGLVSFFVGVIYLQYFYGPSEKELELQKIAKEISAEMKQVERQFVEAQKEYVKSIAVPKKRFVSDNSGIIADTTTGNDVAVIHGDTIYDLNGDAIANIVGDQVYNNLGVLAKDINIEQYLSAR